MWPREVDRPGCTVLFYRAASSDLRGLTGQFFISDGVAAHVYNSHFPIITIIGARYPPVWCAMHEIDIPLT